MSSLFQSRRLLFLINLALSSGSRLYSAEIFVAPGGRDENPGTASAPLQTFAAAQQAARKFAGKETVTVTFADGVYYLPETVRLTPEDSGTAQAPVHYVAAHEGGAILSGGLAVKLSWQPWRDGIYKAELAPNDVKAVEGVGIDQLYVDGKRQRMARYPNAVEGKLIFDAWQGDKAVPDPMEDALSKERIARWANPAGGYLHAMHPALWGDVHWRITGKKPDGSLALEGGWQNNRGSAMHKTYRFIENIFEELDAPGEWFYQALDHSIYYMPPSGVDLNTATVELVRLKHLIEFKGSAEQPVTFVKLRGFTFRHAARTFMENKEPLLRSDWTIYRGGSVVLTGTEDCAIADCTFDQVGGNTIFVSEYNRRVKVSGCLIKESGASGVAFVGDTKAVRSALFSYDKKINYKTVDRTPGPLTTNYPADCVVEDCLITRTGRDEKQTAPIQISMSRGITVRHCSIYDVPRAGININEGTWGGHLIEFCDIFDTVKETGDHGSFNSWGRDRYWDSDVKVAPAEVARDPKLPFLDVERPIILRNNRWRCDHGWDIDLDDGSSNYEITNNLMLNKGLKLREGYRRIVTNNIMVNSSLSPHVWFPESGDIFKHNIVMGSYHPAAMDRAIGKDGKWGTEIDYNLFSTSEADRTKFAANGADAHSVVGDPLFVDAKMGDYRVTPASPALKVGFVNFPMDQFGVSKPALKAIAKTPELPAVRGQAAIPTVKEAVLIWHGATLRDLRGDEFSAVGVAADAAGVFVSLVPTDSQAAKEGLRAGDFIESCNDRSVRNTADFVRLVKNSSALPTKLKILRNQSEQLLLPVSPSS